MEIDQQVGPETVLKAEGANGQIKLSAEYGGVDMNAGAYISASPAQLVGALAKLIPGDSTAEHAALALVLGALELVVK